MEILNIVKLTGAKVDLENTSLNDTEKRKSLVLKTPTITLPFLETSQGNISESKAIEFYLCSKYKPELLGGNTFQKAKINQWIEFGCCELNRCNKSIIYPIFGWNDFCKESFNRDNQKIKDYLKIIENELSKNKYIAGENLTLADVVLFRYLRYLLMLSIPQGLRQSQYKNLEKWFENLMNTPEAVEAYGRTILCKTPLKQFNGKIERPNLREEKKEKVDKFEKEEKEEKNEDKEKEEKEENGEEKGGKKGKKKKKDKAQQKQQKSQKEKEEEKTDKNQGKQLVKEIVKKEYVPSMLELPRFNVKEKENNPLDALPPSKFDLEKFKKEFINNSNKKSAMKKFWKEFDPEGYSLWYIEYNNEPSEFITLFRTVIVKGDILIQLKYFKKYCFGVLGVYGQDGDYKICGCLMWRGQEIPDEIKEINCYNKLTLRKLDKTKDRKDEQLVHDFWTKVKENEKVFKRQAIDTRYFY